MSVLVNIWGAERVHDFSNWPEHQRLFVFCNEPTVLAEIGGLCSNPRVYAYW